MRRVKPQAGSVLRVFGKVTAKICSRRPGATNFTRDLSPRPKLEGFLWRQNMVRLEPTPRAMDPEE